MHKISGTVAIIAAVIAAAFLLMSAVVGAPSTRRSRFQLSRRNPDPAKKIPGALLPRGSGGRQPEAIPRKQMP
jgi:hypothetical protein